MARGRQLPPWSLGVAEITQKKRAFFRALLAEFAGVFFLIVGACGASLAWPTDGVPPSRLHDALAAGVAVATFVLCTCHISGGHLNPAVTIPLLVVGKTSLIRAGFYVLSQCIGAIAGIAVLQSLTPDILLHDCCVTKLDSMLTPAQGFVVEFLITFVFLWTVLAAFDKGRTDFDGSAPAAIGLAVAICQVYAIPLTGASMNPARSFGPALINNFWEHHWIYWIGPIAGGVAAALVYEYIFRPGDMSSHPVYEKHKHKEPLLSTRNRNSSVSDGENKTSGI